MRMTFYIPIQAYLLYKTTCTYKHPKLDYLKTWTLDFLLDNQPAEIELDDLGDDDVIDEEDDLIIESKGSSRLISFTLFNTFTCQILQKTNFFSHHRAWSSTFAPTVLKNSSYFSRRGCKHYEIPLVNKECFKPQV